MFLLLLSVVFFPMKELSLLVDTSSFLVGVLYFLDARAVLGLEIERLKLSIETFCLWNLLVSFILRKTEVEADCYYLETVC